MPFQQEHRLLAILLLSVPIQHFAIQYMGSSESSRTYGISQLLEEVRSFQDRWLSVDPWKRWCVRVFPLYITERTLDLEHTSYQDEGESSAVEVIRYRDKNGYFAQSKEPRNPKPPNVLFRVGQVVQHKIYGYHGVIIGWDVTARAPPNWIALMHGENDSWRTMPNYVILVDTRHRPVPQLTYVPQENIELLKPSKKILHPQVEDHFEHFDGAQYLPKPWLRNIYPLD